MAEQPSQQQDPNLLMSSSDDQVSLGEDLPGYHSSIVTSATISSMPTASFAAQKSNNSSSLSFKNKMPLLDVHLQLVSDALGNQGCYTGQLDVSSHLPHGTGEMQYQYSAEDDDKKQSNVADSFAAVNIRVASYQGKWEKGHWQGHGTQLLDNGDRFVGDFQQSQRGFGEYRWKEEEMVQEKPRPQDNGVNITIRKHRTYQGEFHPDNGRPHGHGKYTWTTKTFRSLSKDGSHNDDDVDDGNDDAATATTVISTYIGMFDNGQRHGHGVFTSSKLQYTGNWLDGKYHGYGVLQLLSSVGKSSTYKGHFHYGVKDGQGEELLEDGTVVHQGLWRKDKPVSGGDDRHTEDVYTSQDAKEDQALQQPKGPISTVFQAPQEIIDGEGILGNYKGIVEDNLPSGVGTILYEKNQHPTGITQYEGFFDQGIRQGYGRAEFGNGDTYHGNWNSGLFEGNGEFAFADGRMYKGAWSNGLPNDKKAKFSWPNNDLFEGSFDNGHRKSGRLVFANGSYYEGEFFSPEGSYGGHGKLVTFMVTYDGDFRDGTFHGQGCLKKNNGLVIFDGTWKDGKALREDVMIAIPNDLLDIPLPPLDDDFGSFEDAAETPPGTPKLQKRNVELNPQGRLGPQPTLSETFFGAPSKLFGSLSSNFSSVMGEHPKQGKPIDDCKAVVDLPVSDAQDNPGRYTGILHMESQRPHGVGRMVYKDGNRIHEGFWSLGNREGHGRCMFAKIGDYHEGEYQKNLRHGPGKYYWRDGRQFIGNYVLDERSGEGKFIYPNGDTYVGNFDKGSRSGYGEFTFSNRTCSYHGEWHASAYHGSGRLQWTTPKGLHVYEGDFESGLFHGRGIEYLNADIRREGRWSRGSYQKDEEQQQKSNDDCGITTTQASGENGKEASDDDDGVQAAPIEKAASKDECPTSLERNYSDSREAWKDALEPNNA